MQREAMLFCVRDVPDAIRLANVTRFGLGASVWTADSAERNRFISEIESGMGIREFTNVKTVWVK